ncbi:hypothetical protein SAMN05444365_10460 [Micromonospora pattaloongensis]|uniref:Uncharacterized protein n=1 Tax=Micromonospora pattaloongensis TaxID=405436 RepID=A0A1H3NMT6_9ACTN|nr:DUF6221 family protein [Micromonospora pattaloongensis]SDY89990.1 hypothetical protein SAMN05444365_10460 [Micromonospora pattaloongensis]
MSNQLLLFLRLRLDEDEVIACGAAGPNARFGIWDVDPWYDGAGERCDLRARGSGVLSGPTGMAVAVVEHVARHDPARVLRDVRAKRALLELIEATPSPYAEPIMRQLALPYADHPDFRREWQGS